jgi:flagellar biosynthesis regulator FlbT
MVKAVVVCDLQMTVKISVRKTLKMFVEGTHLQQDRHFREDVGKVIPGSRRVSNWVLAE